MIPLFIDFTDFETNCVLQVRFDLIVARREIADGDTPMGCEVFLADRDAPFRIKETVKEVEEKCQEAVKTINSMRLQQQLTPQGRLVR